MKPALILSALLLAGCVQHQATSEDRYAAFDPMCRITMGYVPGTLEYENCVAGASLSPNQSPAPSPNMNTAAMGLALMGGASFADAAMIGQGNTAYFQQQQAQALQQQNQQLQQLNGTLNNMQYQQQRQQSLRNLRPMP